jgi:DNA-binding HxlR family transcriptional regulator
MPARKRLDDLGCTIANGVDVFGDRWSLMILRDAFLGVRRFDEFHRDLGIARNVLSDRLERLVAEGILEPRRYEDHPPRHEYLLTEKGEDLLDVMLALWRWGERWDPVPVEDRRVMTHRACGSETQGVVVCTDCGEPLERDGLKVRPLLPVVTERLALAAVTGSGGPTTSG